MAGNFRLGEHDYNCMMELLYLSNPTLCPALRWKEGLWHFSQTEQKVTQSHGGSCNFFP